jgi:hypothetical protein
MKLATAMLDEDDYLQQNVLLLLKGLWSFGFAIFFTVLGL